MLTNTGNIRAAQDAHDDFQRARHKAMRNYILATVTKRPRHPELFSDVCERIVSQSYRGVQQVPLAKIVGSVNRGLDFDSRFNPIHTHTRERWESLAAAMGSGMAVPPVQLYKVGEHYYVQDGNHRVSVARFISMQYIDAEVVELSISAQARGLCEPIGRAAWARSLKTLHPHLGLPSLHLRLHSRPGTNDRSAQAC